MCENKIYVYALHCELPSDENSNDFYCENFPIYGIKLGISLVPRLSMVHTRARERRVW